MGNNQSSPNSISHKELNTFLTRAKKETIFRGSFGDYEINEDQEFNLLIENWTKTSKKILLMLEKKDQSVTKQRPSKSLLALGAMGAHIHLALQALKAASFD